ncbi:3-hydroxyisobutyrate dehydrogenase [Lentzea fradiae]|uniref:3-hydroxyisobutyrate dehydrogenase n=1 Tax=Lentzea fradiae TaxID=200378 RepID=A0A1G7MT78_9PSEU|nr:NAD(P)-binding domain-containing protein [Lentzea fradiae]SDF64897.1 3-hydroxyisobutyrate dehydrogenase [Lentzea fradiae]
MGTKKSVSVLGLGRMGSALANALVGEGYEVLVWNRSADKATPVGAKRVGTPEEAFAAEVVVACLTNYDVLRPLLGNEIRTLVNLTSGTPQEARETARWAREHGVEYVDGVIMAVPQQIGTPGARVLFDGSENHHVLGAFGEPVYVGAEAGLAATYDLALLGVMWSVFGGYLQATALMEAAGVSPERFTPLVGDWLAEVGAMLPEMGQEVRRNDYETDVSAVDINVAGLRMLTEASREQGLDTALPQALHGLFLRAQQAGHGQHSVASVIEVIRK